MPDPSKLLLLDVFHLTLLMLGLGLVVYALIRRSNPLIRWHEHGSVWTDPFGKNDLLVVGILVAFFYWSIRSSVLANGVPAAQSGEPGALDMLVGMMLWVFVTGGLVFLLTYVRGVDVAELFGLTRLKFPQVIRWSCGLFLAAAPIYLLVTFGWIHLLEHAFGTAPDQQKVVESFRDTGKTKILIAFSACVIAPICEEILFRGFFYAVIKRFSERFFAALVVSLLFAAIHGNTLGLVPLVVVAMALTVGYELTGCLLVPIAMHAMFNTTQIIIMYYHMQNG